MIQVVFLVSFFGWLILLNIYQSLMWSRDGVPNGVNWFFSVVVVEAVVALALAGLTLGAALALSWLFRSRPEVPETMRTPEGGKEP